MTEFDIGDVYSLNRKLVQEYEKDLTKEELDKKKDLFIEYIQHNNKCQYFLLLCNDKRDYTIFNYLNHTGKNINEMADIFIECLTNRGKVKGIDLTQREDAIEIWISIENEAFAYYFFPYDNGVIEIGGN